MPRCAAKLPPRAARHAVRSGVHPVAPAAYCIDVVVHVFDFPGTCVVTDEQVCSQIRVLNQDFHGTNTNPLPPCFAPLKGRMNVRFRLAKQDPFGRPTSGVTRITGTTGCYEPTDETIFDAQKGGVDIWDPKRYLNIYVLPCMTEGVLGYATFPDELPQALYKDGVVVIATAFGTTGCAQAPTDGGRTVVHEVGHWLGLIHIWGDDEDEPNCCLATDQVADTPNQCGPTEGCPHGVVTDVCTGEPCGIMYQNYMDYTDDACMGLFTTGQVERMLYFMATFRSTFACKPKRAKCCCPRRRCCCPRKQ